MSSRPPLGGSGSHLIFTPARSATCLLPNILRSPAYGMLKQVQHDGKLKVPQLLIYLLRR